MQTSFHHQPEAQHPKSPAIKTPAGRLPHLRVIRVIANSRRRRPLSAVSPIASWILQRGERRFVPILLQKSQIAERHFFRQKTRQAVITD